MRLLLNGPSRSLLLRAVRICRRPNTRRNLAYTGAITSFAMLGMRTANLDPDDDVYFDGLRSGTTWNDVVPVPEPATAVLLALGLAALAACRPRGQR